MAKVLKEIEVCDVCGEYPVVEPAVLSIGKHAGGENHRYLDGYSSYYQAASLCEKHQNLFNEHLFFEDKYYHDSGDFEALREETVNKLKEIEENK